jgi:hypothetical protein
MLPTFDIGLFRASFPEFADLDRYPDAQITFWSELAECQVRFQAWRKQWLVGVSLYVAHELTLQSQNVSIAAFGGNPGIQSASGPIASKSVGNVNVSYDAESSIEQNAGYFNTTIYGRQLIHLARIFGAGAIQLGGRYGFPGYGGFSR